MQHLTATAPVLGLLIAGTAAAQGVNDPNLVLINEIRIDQPSADDDEYFELLTFPGNSTLDGLTYLVIGDAASGGIIENVTSLDTFVSQPSGIFTGAESTFTLGVADATFTLNFENGDNVTHLVVRDFTGAEGDDLDTDDDGVLDSTPWTEVMDAIGLVEDPMGGDPFYGAALGGVDVGPDGTFVPAHVFRCLTSLTDVRIGQFTDGVFDTPGAFNSACNGTTEPFCVPAENNELGVPGNISLTGSGSILVNDNALYASPMPNTFGVFVQADMVDVPVAVAIGGNVCLRGTIQRMNQIVVIANNETTLPLDFTEPTNVESTTVAGTTMYYQMFYRDSVFPGGGNWTDGVAVTWAP